MPIPDLMTRTTALAEAEAAAALALAATAPAAEPPPITEDMLPKDPPPVARMVISTNASGAVPLATVLRLEVGKRGHPRMAQAFRSLPADSSMPTPEANSSIKRTASSELLRLATGDSSSGGLAHARPASPASPGGVGLANGVARDGRSPLAGMSPSASATGSPLGMPSAKKRRPSLVALPLSGERRMANARKSAAFNATLSMPPASVGAPVAAVKRHSASAGNSPAPESPAPDSPTWWATNPAVDALQASATPGALPPAVAGGRGEGLGPAAGLSADAATHARAGAAALMPTTSAALVPITSATPPEATVPFAVASKPAAVAATALGSTAPSGGGDALTRERGAPAHHGLGLATSRCRPPLPQPLPPVVGIHPGAAGLLWGRWLAHRRVTRSPSVAPKLFELPLGYAGTTLRARGVSSTPETTALPDGTVALTACTVQICPSPHFQGISLVSSPRRHRI
jgi:hypothetical protein